jgi:hypothetical protein
MNPDAQRAVELEFHEAIRQALTVRFDKDGRCSVEELLQDVMRAHPKLWASMLEELAKKAAIQMIRTQVAREMPKIDEDRQGHLWPEIPVQTIRYKRSVVDCARSTAGEYLWYARWFKNWCNGRVKRSEQDAKSLAEIEKSARIVERYARGDESKPLAQVMEARHQQAGVREKKSKPITR